MSPRPPIQLLVTDLDNTLYDWISYFAAAFSRMVGAASRELDVPEEQLLDELRAVHQQSGNTEQPFALAYTPTAEARWPGSSLAERVETLAGVFEQFNRARRDCLVLYPGVRETLQEVRRRGVPLVGLTDAMWPNALHRMRLLELEGLFTHLYAPDPGNTDWSDPLRRGGYPDSPVQLAKLGPSERKPSSSGLRRICADLDVPPDRALYVGDSLVRDVGMAQEVGVRTAWAMFGQVTDLRRWEKVARVTHWSAEEVARDRDAPRDTSVVEPDAVLKESLAEILEAFELSAGG